MRRRHHLRCTVPPHSRTLQKDCESPKRRCCGNQESAKDSTDPFSLQAPFRERTRTPRSIRESSGVEFGERRDLKPHLLAVGPVCRSGCLQLVSLFSVAAIGKLFVRAAHCQEPYGASLCQSGGCMASRERSQSLTSCSKSAVATARASDVSARHENSREISTPADCGDHWSFRPQRVLYYWEP